MEIFDRVVLLLRDVELLPVDDVAAVLEKPPAEIRARAHRARLALTPLAAVSRTSPRWP
jgi:DNA-directed RNA polymerase specialized sigma24 family protein